MRTILKNLILVFTCLLMFLPFIPPLGNFFFPFVAPKGFFFLFLSEIIIFLFFLSLAFGEKVEFKISPLFLAVFLYLFILTLSCLLGPDPSRSFWSKPERMSGLLVHFHLFLFFLVVSLVFKIEDFEKIFGVVALVAIFVTFSFFAHKTEEMYRGGGFLGNSSFFGTYLLFCFFLCLWLLKERKNEFLKWVAAFALFWVVLGLFFSDARAAKVSVVFGLFLILCFYFLFAQKNKALKILTASLLAFSFLAGLFLFYLLFVSDSFVQKLFVKIVGSKARIVVWEGAFKNFLERPILGYGLENFEVIFPKHFHPCLFVQECGGEIWFDRAHNFLFDQLISGGIFGFLFYLLTFLAAFWTLLKKYYAKEISFFTFANFSCLFCAFLLQNLTVFDMPASLLMLFFTLGFVNHFTGTQKKEKAPKFSTPSPNPFLIFLLACLFSLSFFFFVIKPLKSDLNFLSALKTQDSTKRLELLKNIFQSTAFGRYQYREHYFYILSNNPRSVEELNFLESELEKSTKESPQDLKAKLYLGQLKLLKGELTAAEKLFMEALALSPNHQQVLWALSELKFNQGKKEEAIALAQKAVNLEPRLLKAHLVLISLAKEAGNESLAKQKIKEALKINPTWKEELQKLLPPGG